MEDKIEKAKQRYFLAIKNHTRAEAYLKKAKDNASLAITELTEADRAMWDLAKEEDGQ